MSQYNINQNKKNAEYTPYSATADLTKYGIDYSPEQRDAIAQIFKSSADTAYNKALNSYSNEMATQQKSLQDTIRRSQAQAVATGASRGLQAANELSSMLGLQEQAAQGATELQGTYADALANAEKNAMELQNQRAQIGSQMVSAADAAAAQGYSVNMDYQANDPYRVLAEAAALQAEGRNAEADYLLQMFGLSSGADPATIGNLTGGITDPANQSTGANFKTFDVTNGGNWGDKEENVAIKIGETKYKLDSAGLASDDIQTRAQNVPGQAAFVYNGDVYFKASNGKVYAVKERNSGHKDYGNLKTYLQNNNQVLV